MEMSVRKKISLVASIILGLAILFTVKYFFVSTPRDANIIKYEKSRDKEELKKIFYKDYYWLVDNPEFSFDAVFENLSRDKNVENYGTEIINVLYVKDKLAGFITCYMKNFYEGWIHLLAVAEPFRGKRYAELLINKAIEELKKQGAQVIRVLTRPNNQSSQKVYNRMGFKEYKRDDRAVYFEIK